MSNKKKDCIETNRSNSVMLESRDMKNSGTKFFDGLNRNLYEQEEIKSPTTTFRSKKSQFYDKITGKGREVYLPEVSMAIQMRERSRD